MTESEEQTPSSCPVTITSSEKDRMEAGESRRVTEDESISSEMSQRTDNSLVKDTTETSTLANPPSQTEESNRIHKAANDETTTAFASENASKELGLENPIINFYKNKNILITGVTGFIGKAILWKLLDTLRDDIGTIFLLIRSGNVKRSKLGRPADRLKSEVINNKAFQILRQTLGKETFDIIVKNKLVPVSGDLISPDLSIPNADKGNIIENVQIVIHCAATLHFTERLDLSLETNTLGTLRMMDLADECKRMESFIHLSPAYLDSHLPDGHIQERVYPMPLGDPEELLSQIIDLELQDIPKMTERILAHYPNTYTFTKSLTEHLILKRVDLNRIEEVQGGKVQWPIAIVRATQVGAGAFEPLPGWLDGITGANGTVFLMSRGIPALRPGMHHSLADIVPIDYAVRIILSVGAFMPSPGCHFILPYNERVKEDEPPKVASNVTYFPYFYQISACGIDETTWYHIYDSVRFYWLRNASLSASFGDSSAAVAAAATAAISLPPTESYFAANRTVIKPKIFSKYSGLTRSLSTMTTTLSGNLHNKSSAANAISRTLEAASRTVDAMQPFLARHWVFDHANIRTLEQKTNSDTHFNLRSFRHMDWHTYMVNFAYGIHSYVMPNPPLSLRNITVPEGWACALYLHPGAAQHSIIDQQIESVVFSASDIRKRTERMVIGLIASLENAGYSALKNKKRMEQWIDDFDASLDDWCHDDANLLKNMDDMNHLGHWLNTSSSLSTDTSYEEHIRIEVLNDIRVGQSVKQIVESSGVPQHVVVGEALKIFQRMKERTRLPYVWSAGAFLNVLFKRLFTTLRISRVDIARLKEHIRGKNVVYVPASKTIIDQLIIWYICLRYKLPVPAIVCDEALALLGPISDILRIAGTLFVRRDVQARSPLNTAVAAAYINVLLKKHSALSITIERARSRTGRIQPAYHDGVLNMIIEATHSCCQQYLPKDDAARNITNTYSESHVDKDTVLVPVNIIHEKIPELKTIVDQILDQKPPNITPEAVNHPSVDNASPFKNASTESGQYGRVFVGFGDVIDIRQSLERRTIREENDNKRLSTIPVKNENALADILVHKIQRSQHNAMIISPVTLVAATLLFGRLSNGITFGKLYHLVSWLHQELLEKQVPVDWQHDEDVVTVVSYAFKLLDAQEHVIIDDKRITDYTVIRLVEHADNIMKLSYMSGPLIQLFLPEAIFSVVYLSDRGRITKADLLAQFTFLVRLLRHEFIYPWSRKETFDFLLESFVERRLFEVDDDGQYQRSITMENNETEYTQIWLLASLIYPTLDAYWITSCSLSALRDLPFMPRKTVPVLSQWIAAHLIAGRRTIYREVLSIEASQNAIDNFLALGFIDAVHPKTKLSPDAQILLLELGITTNDDLVMVSSRDKDKDESNHSSFTEQLKDDLDLQNILTELNDIASLCHKTEQYRYTADHSGLPHHNNAQVFEKCQNQIRSILRADETYASQRGMKLNNEEEQMIQLVYSLKTASEMLSKSRLDKRFRRVSQAYNLQN
ncbi:male sterility protein-domain-containing protein [Mycotypha africana]|uniref:male sterility protein-domain-containing protein n=1 Tax=Mycotypha africana TaxID=64632 RepID=UPI002301200C|nr:male sterility protein-domain-containing protein [Mycotypha africana]KAI8977495.1 male sterility protein-domain-containing protein [Mycotypha africana]